MERLQSLLRSYNLHQKDIILPPWSKQYCMNDFPTYWKIVYKILNKLSNNNQIIEIGCGTGDVTAIPCYLGYYNIVSFEKNKSLAEIAQRKIDDLFRRNDIVLCEEFPNNIKYSADILILVNCVYADSVNSKDEYLHLIETYYKVAGCPHYYLMEVIDSSYTLQNDEFPKYIRLSKEDVYNLFPHHKIKSWQTYVYPQNNKSKTLYFIERL